MTCSVCQGSFKITAKRRVYCSVRCAGRAVGINGKARIRNPPVTKRCEVCERTWTTFHRSQRFCSLTCGRAGRRKAGNPYHRKDANHDEIRDALVAAGIAVLDTWQFGNGLPDMFVRRTDGTVLLLEVKNPRTAYGRKGLSPAQEALRAMFPGAFRVVLSVEEALAAVGLVPIPAPKP